jgi:TIR domain/Predicted nucleotide-binding protein containing TIR-like domain
MTKPSVFISSSHEDLDVAREFARQLEATAVVTLWSESAFYPGKTVVESLTEVADRSDFAVFVLAANDVSMTPQRHWAPHPNVIFELGFLAGRLGLSRTFVVVADLARVALPTDLAGTMYIALAPGGREDLGARVAPAAAVIRRAIGEIQKRQDRSVNYYSCFLSYSWNDKDFAVRLHDDLQEVGVSCWLDAKELRVGDSLMDQIDRAIQAHDKVLLVLSKASVQSSWVRFEVRNALALESARQKTVLFPIRIDDAVLEVSGVQEIDRLKEKYIVDFSRWQDRSHYQRAFSRLVRDLAISASVESGGHE